MEFAWACPTFAGSGDAHPDTPSLSRIAFEQIVDYALECERLEFDSVWVADHMMLGRDSAIFECWTSLSALAGQLQKIRLSVLGFAPEFRNPAVSAKMIATLDVISKGRFEYIVRGILAPDSFGLKQWGVPTRDEFDAYGARWDDDPTKIRRAEETVKIAKLLWSKDDVTFNGEFYNLKNATCNPKPVQKPFPPILVEGDDEKLTLPLAAKLDGWVGCGTPALMEKKIGIVREFCEQFKTDFKAKKHAWIGYVLTGKDRASLDEKLERIRSLNPKYPLDSNDYLAENMIGTVEEVKSRLGEFAKAGVNYLAVFFLDYPSMDSMKLFSEIKSEFTTRDK